MHVKQISVFLENNAGRHSEVTAILAEAGINIRALSVADTSDFGVLRLIVNDNQKALEALKNNGFSVGITDVVAVEVADKPGGLHQILNLLHQAQINVEYMYAFVQQSGSNAVMIFRFDHVDEAIRLLEENGLTVINGPSVYAM
ncbi:MAG: ACT domain-containing protein [Desulfatirhabdiaceae bacterium]|nr:ACT domain-containing protein [Desulfatirhabdiaceae bacterium]